MFHNMYNTYLLTYLLTWKKHHTHQLDCGVYIVLDNEATSLTKSEHKQFISMTSFGILCE